MNFKTLLLALALTSCAVTLSNGNEPEQKQELQQDQQTTQACEANNAVVSEPTPTTDQQTPTLWEKCAAVICITALCTLPLVLMASATERKLPENWGTLAAVKEACGMHNQWQAMLAYLEKVDEKLKNLDKVNSLIEHIKTL